MSWEVIAATAAMFIGGILKCILPGIIAEKKKPKKVYQVGGGGDEFDRQVRDAVSGS